jgi:hypothetical protein
MLSSQVLEVASGLVFIYLVLSTAASGIKEIIAHAFDMRSEKRAVSLGLHSFRNTNATAMDSLAIHQQTRKQRLGHSGNSVTENYTHTFTQDERDAAEKLGEFFGTGWPEIDKGKLISFPSPSQTKEGPGGCTQQALSFTKILSACDFNRIRHCHSQAIRNSTRT